MVSSVHAMTWFPFVISAGNASSFLLSSFRRPLAGAAVLFVTQGLFIAYSTMTDQYGFYLQNIVMMIAAVLVFIRLRPRREKPATQADPVDEFPASWVDHG
jgi:hypothetical protein